MKLNSNKTNKQKRLQFRRKWLHEAVQSRCGAEMLHPCTSTFGFGFIEPVSSYRRKWDYYNIRESFLKHRWEMKRCRASEKDFSGITCRLRANKVDLQGTDSRGSRNIIFPFTIIS